MLYRLGHFLKSCTGVVEVLMRSGSARLHLIQEIDFVPPPFFLDGQFPLKFALSHLINWIVQFVFVRRKESQHSFSLFLFFGTILSVKKDGVLQSFFTTRHSIAFLFYSFLVVIRCCCRIPLGDSFHRAEVFKLSLSLIDFHKDAFTWIQTILCFEVLAFAFASGQRTEVAYAASCIRSYELWWQLQRGTVTSLVWWWWWRLLLCWFNVIKHSSVFGDSIAVTKLNYQ
jgi:hypothetical protein